MTFSRIASSKSSLGTLGVSIGMQNLQELNIKVIEVAKYLPDCMKLIFKAPLLRPIVDELLNILYTKLAWVVWFCSSFYPTRIVEYKAWATWVCYLIVDHAHPTLGLLLVDGRINGGAYWLQRTSNPALTSVGSSCYHQLDYRY